MNMEPLNEPIAAVIVGLLLSLSAGVRTMLPLLAVNLLAFYQVIVLPKDLDWLGSEPTLILLVAAPSPRQSFITFPPPVLSSRPLPRPSLSSRERCYGGSG